MAKEILLQQYKSQGGLGAFYPNKMKSEGKKKDQNYNNRNDNYGLSWESYPLVPSMNAFVWKGRMQ